jgi:uncharacterized protein
VNPLASYATAEVQRCARQGFHGLKLHLANSGVDLLDGAHRRLLASVLDEAGEAGLPVALHLRATRPWGAGHVEAFVRDVAPAARGLGLQIAHLGGWGGYDRETAHGFAVLSRLLDDGHDVYFDLSAVVRGPESAGVDRLATDLSAVPADRLLFGTDWPDWTARAYTASLQAVGVDPGRFATRAPWVPL